MYLIFNPSRTPSEVRLNESYRPGEMAAEKTPLLRTLAVACLSLIDVQRQLERN